MNSLDLHNSWNQALFVRVSQARENVVESGTSLHIKNRLVQPSQKACASQTPIYAGFHPLILQIVHWHAEAFRACVFVGTRCLFFFTPFDNAPVLRTQRQSISLLLLFLRSSSCCPRINPHFKRLLLQQIGSRRRLSSLPTSGASPAPFNPNANL